MFQHTELCLTKEETFCEILTIPPHKPGIHRLVDCMIIPEIIEYKSLSTAQGLSYEGQLLTGLTLSILLQLNLKVTYISNTPEQTLHAIHYTHFKSAHIQLPLMSNGQDTCSIVESELITILPQVSSIKSFIINPRAFQQCALLSIKINLT